MISAPTANSGRITGNSEVILGQKSACGKSQLRPLNCGPKGCRFERWLNIPTMRSHVVRTMALPPKDLRQAFGPTSVQFKRLIAPLVPA